MSSSLRTQRVLDTLWSGFAAEDRKEEVIVKRRFIDLSQNHTENSKFTRLDLNRRAAVTFTTMQPRARACMI